MGKKIKPIAYYQKESILLSDPQHIKMAKLAQLSKLKKSRKFNSLSNLINIKNKKTQNALQRHAPTVMASSALLGNPEAFFQQCCLWEKQYKSYGAIKITFSEKLYQDQRHLSEICSGLVSKGLCISKTQRYSDCLFKKSNKYGNHKMTLKVKQKTIGQFWKTLQQQESFHAGSINFSDFQKFGQTIKPIGGVCQKLFPQLFNHYSYEVVLGGQLSSFGLHFDPYSLSGINYLGKGGTKYWYIIPQNKTHKLKQLVAQATKRQKMCMWHLTLMIDPIKLNRDYFVIEQNENQLVLIFQGVAHQGVNLGANMAFLSSYSSKSWLFQKNHSSCSCSGTLSQQMLQKMAKQTIEIQKINYLQEQNIKSQELSIPVELQLILFRDQQQERIRKFIDQFIKFRTSTGCLVVSGSTGLGKTICIERQCQNFKEQAGIVPVFVNFLTITNEAQIYRQLSKYISRSHSQGGLKFLQKYFSQEPELRGDHLMVMVLDEFDFMSKNSKLIYNMLQWSLQPRSGLSLIFSSNQVNFKQNLSRNVHSRMGYEEIVFGPYKRSELVEICKSKRLLKGISEQILHYAVAQIIRDNSDFRNIEKFMKLVKQIRGVKNQDIIIQDIIEAKKIYNCSGKILITKLSEFNQKIYRVLCKVREYRRLNAFTAQYFISIAKNFENMTIQRTDVPFLLIEFKQLGIIQQLSVNQYFYQVILNALHFD